MIRSIAAISLVAISCISFGWDAKGHQIIAEIAYRDLTPTAQRTAARLLNSDTDSKYHDFPAASVWADDIKSKTRDFDNWHYINRFVGNPEIEPAKPNVVTAMAEQSKILGNSNTADASRLVALKWMLHLVGDVHQPLHTSARMVNGKNDRGGNDFLLGTGRGENLHSFWDRALTEATRGKNIQESADMILAQINSSADSKAKLEKEVKESSPDAWVNEGYGVANDFLYKLPEGQSPNPDYVKKAQSASMYRAALAGKRLAIWLNTLLKNG